MTLPPPPISDALVDAAIEAFEDSLPPELSRATMLSDLEEPEIRAQIATVLPAFLGLGGDRSMLMRHAVEFAFYAIIALEPSGKLTPRQVAKRKRQYTALANATRAFLAAMDAVTWMDVLEFMGPRARHHWLLEIRAKSQHRRRGDLEKMAKGAERAGSNKEKTGPKPRPYRAMLMQTAAASWTSSKGKVPGHTRDAHAGGPVRGDFVEFLREIFTACRLKPPSERDIKNAAKWVKAGRNLRT